MEPYETLFGSNQRGKRDCMALTENFPLLSLLIVFKTPKTGLYTLRKWGALSSKNSDVVYTCLYPYRYSPLYCINIAMCPDTGQTSTLFLLS